MANENICQGIAGAAIATKTFVIWDGADTEFLVTNATNTLTTTAGVSIEAAADTEPCRFVFQGFATAIAAGVIEPGDECMVTTAGHLVVATTGKVVVAKYLPSPRGTANGPDAASGGEIRVWVYANKFNLLA